MRGSISRSLCRLRLTTVSEAAAPPWSTKRSTALGAAGAMTAASPALRPALRCADARLQIRPRTQACRRPRVRSTRPGPRRPVQLVGLPQGRPRTRLYIYPTRTPTPAPNEVSCYASHDEHTCTPLNDLPGYQAWCDANCLNVASWHPACRQHVDQAQPSDLCSCSCNNAGPTAPTLPPSGPADASTACCRPLRPDYPIQWCRDSCSNGPDWHPACRRDGDALTVHTVCDCECTGNEPTSRAPTSAPVTTGPTLGGITFAPTGAPTSTAPMTAAPTSAPSTSEPTTVAPTPSPGAPTVAPGAKKLVGCEDTDMLNLKPRIAISPPALVMPLLLEHCPRLIPPPFPQPLAHSSACASPIPPDVGA